MTEAVNEHALPPGPNESASEQVRRYIETPVEFWEQCERDFGSATTLEFGSLGRVVLLSDPEHLRELFRLPTEAFECHQYNEHYRYVMGDLSLLLQDGATHRRQRRLLAPMFRHDQLLPKMSAMRDIVLGEVDRWPAGKAFNPRPSLHDITFQTMVRLIFGDLDSPTSSALITAYRKSVSTQVGSWGPWRNFARMQPQIRLQLADEIERRRANPELPGFMTHLAMSTDTEGAPLSNEECEDHVFSLLVAGVDTSAISLAWALHWLSRETAIRERVVAELPQAGNDETGKALLSLPYLQAVYAETIRMYPIVPTPSGRKLLRDTQIGPYLFEAGVTLVPCTYLVHRREELYPDAGAFRPERFLERKFAPYEYLPYGGGARICVGEMLAKYEFTVAVSAILGRWQLETTDAPPMRPVRHGTLLAPPDSLELVVH
jgi:cytochrome P450